MSQTNKERLKLLFFVALMMAVDEYKAEINSFEHSYLTFVYPVLFGLGLGLINIAYKKFKTSRSGIFIKTTFDTPRRITWIALSIAILAGGSFIEWSTFMFFWLILYSGTYLLLTGIFYRNSVHFIINEGLLCLHYKDRSHHELSTLNSFELENTTLRLLGEDKTIEVYRISEQKNNIDKLTTFLNDFKKLKRVET